MFGRIFLYKLKELIRMKWIIGWNFLFPIVLATAFALGFGNLIDDDPIDFHTIPVGYVSELSAGDAEIYEPSAFLQVLEELSDDTKNDTTVLQLYTYASEAEAKDALSTDEISGYYLEDDEDIHTTVPSNGITSTTMLQIVKEYKNYKETLENIAVDHPEAMADALDTLTSDTSFLSQHDFGNDTSPYLQYFYALLAMASLYGSWISTAMLTGMCANMSECGKRFECAPGRKLVAITAGTLAGLCIQALANAVTVLYIQYVLRIDLSAPIGYIILITTLGSAVGISVGNLFGSILKNPILLTVVPLSFAMLCSMCSGLMVATIRQAIEYYAPFFNRINPGAVMTDALYHIGYYGTTRTFYIDLMIMGIIIILNLVISGVLLRRRNYASI
jgi:ABC-2 type transport system permease protein